MYFNRNGELVVSVDTVENWLDSMAQQTDNPDAFLALDNAKGRWADDINSMLVMIMEKNDR